MNAGSFELALALLRYGHQVSEIYGTVSDENFIYIKKIAELSPETKIYTNLSPSSSTMIVPTALRILRLEKTRSIIIRIVSMFLGIRSASRLVIPDYAIYLKN